MGTGSGDNGCWIARGRIALGRVRLRFGDDGSRASNDECGACNDVTTGVGRVTMGLSRASTGRGLGDDGPDPVRTGRIHSIKGGQFSLGFTL